MRKGRIREFKQAGMAVLVGYLSLAMLTGCTTVRIAVQDPVSPVKFERPVLDNVTLKVEVSSDQYKADASVDPVYEAAFIQEKLEKALVNTLTASGIAKQVSAQTSPGAWKLLVKGNWDSKTPWHKSLVKAIQFAFVMLLLGIPFFFMTNSVTANSGADVILTDPSGLERGRITVASMVDADIAYGKMGTMNLMDEMIMISSEDLANRVVLELKRHLHWFEAAR